VGVANGSCVRRNPPTRFAISVSAKARCEEPLSQANGPRPQQRERQHLRTRCRNPGGPASLPPRAGRDPPAPFGPGRRLSIDPRASTPQRHLYNPASDQPPTRRNDRVGLAQDDRALPNAPSIRRVCFPSAPHLPPPANTCALSLVPSSCAAPRLPPLRAVCASRYVCVVSFYRSVFTLLYSYLRESPLMIRRRRRPTT